MQRCLKKKIAWSRTKMQRFFKKNLSDQEQISRGVWKNCLIKNKDCPSWFTVHCPATTGRTNTILPVAVVTSCSFFYKYKYKHYHKCKNKYYPAGGRSNKLLLLAPSGALIAIPTYYWSTTHPTPLFQITPVLNTGLSLSEPLQLYKGYNAI